MTAQETFVIVGAGLAGAKAAEALRAEGFDGRVVLIGRRPSGPTTGPRCPRITCRDKSEKEKIYVHLEGWYVDHNVDLRLESRGALKRLGLDPGKIAASQTTHRFASTCHRGRRLTLLTSLIGEAQALRWYGCLARARVAPGTEQRSPGDRGDRNAGEQAPRATTSNLAWLAHRQVEPLASEADPEVLQVPTRSASDIEKVDRSRAALENQLCDMARLTPVVVAAVELVVPAGRFGEHETMVTYGEPRGI